MIHVIYRQVLIYVILDVIQEIIHSIKGSPTRGIKHEHHGGLYKHYYGYNRTKEMATHHYNILFGNTYLQVYLTQGYLRKVGLYVYFTVMARPFIYSFYSMFCKTVRIRLVEIFVVCCVLFSSTKNVWSRLNPQTIDFHTDKFNAKLGMGGYEVLRERA